MINPSEFDISTLPSLPLELKRKLPKQAAIYLAVNQEGKVLYVGQSVNPKTRWTSHHKYKELRQIGNVKIHYLVVESSEMLGQIERALIEWFDPPLNFAGRSKSARAQDNRVKPWKKRPPAVKRQPTQLKGGRLPGGSPAISSDPKRNAGIALSNLVLDAINDLPQVSSGEWSRSYLVEQLLRNYLGLSADYEWSDLTLIAQRRIVE